MTNDFNLTNTDEDELHTPGPTTHIPNEQWLLHWNADDADLHVALINAEIDLDTIETWDDIAEHEITAPDTGYTPGGTPTKHETVTFDDPFTTETHVFVDSVEWPANDGKIEATGAAVYDQAHHNRILVYVDFAFEHLAYGEGNSFELDWDDNTLLDFTENHHRP